MAPLSACFACNSSWNEGVNRLILFQLYTLEHHAYDLRMLVFSPVMQPSGVCGYLVDISRVNVRSTSARRQHFGNLRNCDGGNSTPSSIELWPHCLSIDLGVRSPTLNFL